MNRYIKAKIRIFSAQKTSDYSYININNKYYKFIKNELKRKKIKSKLVYINNKNYKNFIDKIKNKIYENKTFSISLITLFILIAITLYFL